MSPSAPRVRPWNAALDALRHWHGRLQPRERRALLIAALVLASAAVLMSADWLLAERARLARQLPTLRAAHALMQQDSEELARLRALPAAARRPAAEIGRTAAAAAEARGLALDIEAAADGLHVGGSANLAALVDWLAAVQADAGLRVQRLRLDADGRIEAVLALPDADA